MQLDYRFYRLPIRVDTQRIKHELKLVHANEWISHPHNYTGNSALPLISINGQDNHDVIGQMTRCPRLEKMPYVKQVLASLNTNLGRCRFMKLDAGMGVPPHCDTNLYWQKRMRIHIPIITNDTVLFTSGGQVQHMAEGEAWIVDTWHKHSVCNHAGQRIHLVVDTQGSPNFWSILNTQAWKPLAGKQLPPTDFDIKPVAYDQAKKMAQVSLPIEESDHEIVLNPDRVNDIIDFYLTDIDACKTSNHFEEIKSALSALTKNWQTIWETYGSSTQYHLSYRLTVLQTIERLKKLTPEPRLKTNQQALSTLLAQFNHGLSQPQIPSNKPIDNSKLLSFDFEPVFIVAAPRSGSTLLYETLGHHDQLMHYDAESHNAIESIPSLSIEENGSNELYARHSNETIANKLKHNFLQRLEQTEIAPKTKSLHFLEKTPKNALRIDFLKAAFPNARFIYLFRQPHTNISSIVDGWKSGRFITYQNLKGWDSKYEWSFLLPQGWRELPQNDLAAIAAYQYRAANQSIINSLGKLEKGNAIALSYEEFVTNPRAYLEKICDFLDLKWSDKFDNHLDTPGGLALSKYTLDAPAKDKWLKNKTMLEGVLPEMQGYFCSEVLPAVELINLRNTVTNKSLST